MDEGLLNFLVVANMVQCVVIIFLLGFFTELGKKKYFMLTANLALITLGVGECVLSMHVDISMMPGIFLVITGLVYAYKDLMALMCRAFSSLAFWAGFLGVILFHPWAIDMVLAERRKAKLVKGS